MLCPSCRTGILRHPNVALGMDPHVACDNLDCFRWFETSAITPPVFDEVMTKSMQSYLPLANDRKSAMRLAPAYKPDAATSAPPPPS